MRRLVMISCFVAALLARPAGAMQAAPAPETAGGSIDLAAHALLLEDPDGSLAVDEVRRRFAEGKVVPAPAGGVALGYTRSAWWIGFRVPASPAGVADPRRVLEIGFPTLDRIDFHAPGTDVPVVTGDRRPFAERAIAHRNFAFFVTPPPGRDSDPVLLRVQSEGTLSVPLTLWTPDAFAEAGRASYAGMAIYFGALLALLVFNALVWIIIRDRAYLYYMVLLGGLATGVAGFSGLGYQFAWTNWPAFANLAFPLGYSIGASALAQFTRCFLGMSQVSVLLDRLLAASALFSLATGLCFFADYALGGKLLSVATIAASVLAVAAGAHCLRRKVPQARLFLFAWTVFLFFGVIFSLRNVGFLPSSFITLHGLQFGSVITMLLLSFALANRIQEERSAREAAQAEVLAAKQASIEMLQKSEQELEGRVAQRTAELEAANDRLSQNERQLRRLAQHDALTGLANRTLFTDRLEHAIAAAQRDESRFALLFLDLDRFKPVNDTHGHAVGDALLQDVANRISGRVRESDTVARIGGDEFVVILRRIESADDAVEVGNSIRNTLNKPFHVGKLQLSISCSVGIAVYPEDGGTEIELSRQADEAMYRAKQSGRDVVCLAASAG